MEKVKDPIGEILRKAREARGVSVPELAETIGIPKDRIYKWEQGKATPQYEDRNKINEWISGTWNNLPQALVKKAEARVNYSDELIKVLKEQNEYLRKLIETNLNDLSSDVNNNTAAIRAEIRGYAHRQILKEVNNDDEAFLKAKAEADKIYLLNLKLLLKGNKPSEGN